MKNKAVSPCRKPVKVGRIGDLKIVANQNPHPRAASKYFAVRLQHDDGREVSALFTATEIDRALGRARKNPEDVPVADDLLSRIKVAID